MTKKLNILFICKSNLFRSKVAEYYLKKINKGVNVQSAGIVMNNTMSSEQGKAIKETGINLNKKQQPLTSKLLKEQDLIIIVASDVPKSLFNKNFLKNTGIKAKIIEWSIKDIYELKGNNKKENTKRVIKRIINKIDLLNKQLKKLK